MRSRDSERLFSPPKAVNVPYNWVPLETVGINHFSPELLHVGFCPLKIKIP